MTITDASGVVMVDLFAEFDDWHLANIYCGSDGYIVLDNGADVSFSIDGKYQDAALTSVVIRGFPLWPDLFCENYIGEVLIFFKLTGGSAKQSSQV